MTFFHNAVDDFQFSFSSGKKVQDLCLADNDFTGAPCWQARET